MRPLFKSLLLALAPLAMAPAESSAQYLTGIYFGNRNAPTQPGWAKVGVNLNQGSGNSSDVIYMFKRVGNERSQALRGFKVLEGKGAAAPAGWTKHATDLNRGVGGAYIYLFDTRLESAGPPIADVYAVTGNTRAEALKKIPNGWKMVDVDLNKGAGGDFIYLIYVTAQPQPMKEAAKPILPKRVYASSVYQFNQPQRAFDRDPKTFWSATAGPPQWIEADLGAAYEIKRMELDVWLNQNAKTSWVVYISNDSIRDKKSMRGYFLRPRETKSGGDTFRLLLSRPTGRYVQIRNVRIENDPQNFWTALTEIRVYGKQKK